MIETFQTKGAASGEILYQKKKGEVVIDKTKEYIDDFLPEFCVFYINSFSEDFTLQVVGTPSIVKITEGTGTFGFRCTKAVYKIFLYKYSESVSPDFTLRYSFDCDTSPFIEFRCSSSVEIPLYIVVLEIPFKTNNLKINNKPVLEARCSEYSKTNFPHTVKVGEDVVWEVKDTTKWQGHVFDIEDHKVKKFEYNNINKKLIQTEDYKPSGLIYNAKPMFSGGNPVEDDFNWNELFKVGGDVDPPYYYSGKIFRKNATDTCFLNFANLEQPNVGGPNQSYVTFPAGEYEVNLDHAKFSTTVHPKKNVYWIQYQNHYCRDYNFFELNPIAAGFYLSKESNLKNGPIICINKDVEQDISFSLYHIEYDALQKKDIIKKMNKTFNMQSSLTQMRISDDIIHRGTGYYYIIGHYDYYFSPDSSYSATAWTEPLCFDSKYVSCDWYTTPDTKVYLSESIEISSKSSQAVIVEIEAPRGVSFNQTDNDPDWAYKTTYNLDPNQTIIIDWYNFSQLADQYCKFTFTIFYGDGNGKIETFTRSAEESTTTSTTARFISTEGNFTLYRGKTVDEKTVN